MRGNKPPPNPEAWIDLEDYLLRGKRKEKILPVTPSVAQLPPHPRDGSVTPTTPFTASAGSNRLWSRIIRIR